eukprot:753561-Hanusia_phi.AAC.4
MKKEAIKKSDEYYKAKTAVFTAADEKAAAAEKVWRCCIFAKWNLNVRVQEQRLEAEKRKQAEDRASAAISKQKEAENAKVTAEARVVVLEKVSLGPMLVVWIQFVSKDISVAEAARARQESIAVAEAKARQTAEQEAAKELEKALDFERKAQLGGMKALVAQQEALAREDAAFHQAKLDSSRCRQKLAEAEMKVAQVGDEVSAGPSL